jgi:hydroxymethylglutaryl-CoA reductase
MNKLCDYDCTFVQGCERALQELQQKVFPDMKVISLSGNFCCDKKPAAVNWLVSIFRSTAER